MYTMAGRAYRSEHSHFLDPSSSFLLFIFQTVATTSTIIIIIIIIFASLPLWLRAIPTTIFQLTAATCSNLGCGCKIFSSWNHIAMPSQWITVAVDDCYSRLPLTVAIDDRYIVAGDGCCNTSHRRSR